MHNIIEDYQRHLTSMELSGQTLINYTRVITLMEDWLRAEYQVDFSDPNAIKGYMISMYCTSIRPLKIGTRTLYLTIVKAFLKWMFAMQYIDHDLSQAVAKLPTIDKYNAAHPEEAAPKRSYTAEEIRAMLTCPRRSEFVQFRDRAIIATMLATGLRVSELAALTVEDVIAEPSVIYVPRKGTHGQKAAVSIAAPAYPYIMQYLDHREKKFPVDLDDPLWVSGTNAPLDRKKIYLSLSDMQKKLGIPTGTHTFRHTMVTEVTKRANPIAARDAAGQKSITVTNRYMHSTRQEIQDAVDLAGELIREALGLPEHG